MKEEKDNQEENLKLNKEIIKNLNKDFLQEHNVCMIGGTAISMLNGDYRTSSDIDLLMNEHDDGVDFSKVLIENDRFSVIEVKKDYYSTKIFIEDSENENGGRKFKIEFVKFDNFIKKGLLREEEQLNTIHLTEVNDYNLNTLTVDNLIKLKIASFYSRQGEFPYKDYFDLMYLFEKYDKPLVNIDGLEEHIKEIGKGDLAKFGKSLFRETFSLITNYSTNFELAKKTLKIKENIGVEDMMGTYIKYIEFEKGKGIDIDRDPDILNLEFILLEKNIDIKATQKRRLGLKPTENEIMFEEVQNILDQAQKEANERYLNKKEKDKHKKYDK